MTVSLLANGACATGGEEDSYDFVDGKSDGAGGVSYGQLARAKVPPALTAVTNGLAVIDGDVLPHEAKAVRKQIAELRDYVDLFAYAYTTKDGDFWKDIRKDLDNGYEVIGEFKDLFDRQGVTDPMMAVYDPSEVAEQRGLVLEWQAGFDAIKADYKLYLADASLSKLHDRDRDDLGNFFWGATSLEPSKSKSGMKNMAKLARELLELAIDDYDEVLDVRELHKPQNQEVFHDFRKRVRSVSRLPVYFPQIMDADDDVTEELALVSEAVDRYGAINDKITKYAHDPDGDLKDDIADEWKELRDWQKEHDFEKVLDDVHDAIRK